jgi:precorrin-3B methylase
MGVGSLTVVGTGFGGGGQITADASHAIATSDKVLYLVADASAAEWIRAANPTSESLGDCYFGRVIRIETYFEITERILWFVRSGLRVCAVFYGHPGVFVFPSLEAIVLARNEGFDARMLPGVSAADCLFADLGVDPGRRGCLAFDATDFLVRRRRADVTVPMILWQAGAVGRVDYPRDGNRDNIKILSDVLQELYGPGHEVVIYEATRAPDGGPMIEFVSLEHLAETSISLISTVYVPPRDEPHVDEDMARRLGMPEDFLLTTKSVSSGYIPWRPYAEPEPRPLYGR